MPLHLCNSSVDIGVAMVTGVVAVLIIEVDILKTMGLGNIVYAEPREFMQGRQFALRLI